MIVPMLDHAQMEFAIVILDLREKIVQQKFAQMVALETVFAQLTISHAHANLDGLDLIAL
jgi:hypothetical protein